MRGVYPGSFNPPTLAHIAIIEAAIQQHRLAELHLVVSQVALAKEDVIRPSLDHRVEVITASVAHLSQVSVHTTQHQLLADIATGYDLLVMGADKWIQIQDVIFYNHSPVERDAALARLPQVAIAPRLDLEIPHPNVLSVPRWAADISSSAARSGQAHQMTHHARQFDAATGAWSDPRRYDRLHG